MFDSLSTKIRDAQKIVFVTGAGISQESGIPTFRGKDGLWRKYDAMQLATIDAFYENPQLVWEWYEERRRNIMAAKPNAGHDAIARLERFRPVSILTQNIDGLHQRAGSTRVSELHGSIVRIKCTVCDFKDNITSSFPDLPPLCRCKNILRPDVVWFGEPLPQDVWQDALQQASSCDLMVVVGTSLAVSPANLLPVYAKQGGATLIEVNPEDTQMSSAMDLSVRSSAARALPDLVALFG
ncbi:MAG TPA: NAD-dependent deacylase [Candidatus Nitrosotalea sp.]|nr:NAD-dependent deacylase [Candidatus Nitrosotalea sp.]